MCAFAQKAKISRKNIYLVWASLFYAFIFGIRYGVGRDYPSYLSNYLTYLHNTTQITQDEVGFAFLQDLFAGLGAHPIFFFGFISFAEISLCYYLIRDKKELYIPFTIVYVLSAAWLPFSSALRQALATCIFFIALQYTDLKSIYKYYLLVCICFLIHKSAALLFLFFPVFLVKKEWFRRPTLELFFYWVAVVCMVTHVFESLFSIFESQIEALAVLMSYDNYLDSNYADAFYTRDDSIGLGQLVYILLYSVFIANSNRVKNYFKDEYLGKAYDLFFIGAVLKCLFNGSNLFGRVTWYFEYFYLIVGPFTLLYLHRRNKRWYYATLFLIILIFVAVLYKGDINYANYYFWWEKAQFEADHAGNIIKVDL